ncbi:MAG TPA: xanthine dehydrogenase family protein molybdopterin-binding subunit [Verrucomicrobiae bacterium]|nr:xanthine dehydrogenase family protein molybdopterin-binding subunit [Verrucomicrobiae bacterium]
MSKSTEILDKQIAALHVTARSSSAYEQKQMKVVGKGAQRLDAVGKATGETKYGQDLFSKKFLFAKALRAAHPHAEILSIDPREAKKVPGVITVLTHKDVSGTNLHGLIRRDQEVLCSHKVRYLGDAIAIVVATDEEIAGAALRKIKVDYKPLPALFTMEDALKPDAPKIHAEGNVLGEKHLRKGDAPTAMAEADVIVEDVIQTQSVDHAFLDLEAGRARWDGKMLTIEVSGQWLHEERRLIALALGLPLEKLRIIQPATGGAFGGREDISIQIYLGLCALKLKAKTICMRYSRAESMMVRHKRHPIRVHYKLGAKKDGTLVAAQVTFYVDKGAYASTGIAVMRKASSHATGPYKVPNVWVDVIGVFTNNNPCGAMRGFGAAQTAIAYEGLMDRLAVKLGMDKAELRMKNLVKSGDEVTTGQVVPYATAVECFDAVLTRIDWKNRSYATPAPHLKRGYGVSIVCFGLGYGDGFPDASRARCRLTKDGIVELYSSGVDVGQGLINMVSQIAAEEIGVPLEKVRPILADTQLTPESGSTSATRQTYFTGSAVQLAAAELKKQLQDIAAAHLKELVYEIQIENGEAYNAVRPAKRMTLKELAREGKRRGFSLEATSVFKPPTMPEDTRTGQSMRAFVTYLFGSHACQLLVDTETGEVKIERYIACHDVGRAINPDQVIGQIQGGVTMGIGMALMEEVVLKDGRILNPGFTDYILPTIRDVPEIECIVLENPDPGGPFGARGVGEPPLIGTGPAILSAIYDAIGTPVRELPATPERIWRAMAS